MKNFKLALAGIATVVAVAGASFTGVLAATNSADVVINATIEQVISGADLGGGTNPDGTPRDHTVPITVTPGTVSTNTTPHNISISTNAAGGYVLTLQDKDTNTALRNGSNSINAASGTFSAPSTLSDNTWGYRVEGLAAFTNPAHYAGVPANGSPVTIKSATGPVSADATQLNYGVLATTAMPSGVYTDTIVLTITTQP